VNPNPGKTNLRPTGKHRSALLIVYP